MNESPKLMRALVGVLMIWPVWIPLAICLIVLNPQNVPDWSAPVICFGWWPLAFYAGWRVSKNWGAWL